MQRGTVEPEQGEEPSAHFRKGDTVWWEPEDPILRKSPRTTLVAGWLGTVNYDTGEALFLRFDEGREEYGKLVPISELRRRSIT